MAVGLSSKQIKFAAEFGGDANSSKRRDIQSLLRRWRNKMLAENYKMEAEVEIKSSCAGGILVLSSGIQRGKRNLERSST